MNTQVTLKELTTAVRELTFDRFVVPAFAIKALGSPATISIEPTGDNPALTILDAASQTTSYSLSTYDTCEKLLDKFIEDGVIVAYTPYFRGEEPTSALLKVTNVSLANNFTAFRRHFFSDSEIIKTIEWYYARVLDIFGQTIDDTLVGKLIRPSEIHLALWVSYQIVDKRRLYENAAQAIGQSFTDGSDYVGMADASNGTGTTTSVQIGSVFSIQEDPTKGFYYEDYNRVGSDNTWGDRYSFWYKLMLYLRGKLEEEFGDYSLRKTNVIPGNIELIRDLDFRAYYDSYPFTLSPLSRGILSKTP